MTIKTLPAPCWRLIETDGTDHDPYDEGAAHHADEAAARKVIADLGLGSGEPSRLRAAPFAFCCRELRCDGCGKLAEDYDSERGVHFPDGMMPLSMLDAYGFVRGSDGNVRCETCAPRFELAKVGG